MQRTASSFLVGALLRQPDIWCHGEVFQPGAVKLRGLRGPDAADIAARLETLRWRDPQRFLKKVYALNGGRPIVGFKMFQKHNPEMFAEILADDTIKKVILHRYNPLARYASLRAAQMAKNWSGSADRPLVKFDGEDFERARAEQVAFYDYTRAALDEMRQQYFWIEREDVNSPAAFGELLRFLEATAPFEEMRPVKEKMGSPDIVSRFSNPEAVRTFLAARGWEALATESAPAQP